MFNLRVAVVFCCLSALLCIASPAAMGQGAATTGTVAGLITDSSGGAIVGATITLTDRATNIALTTNSNQAGRYVFVNVTPGVTT